MEELRAKLSSAFIAGELDIPADIPNHVSYIQSWLRPLKDSKHEIFRAAADAQRIVDMVRGFHPDFALKAENHPDRPRVPPTAQPNRRGQRHDQTHRPRRNVCRSALCRRTILAGSLLVRLMALHIHWQAQE